MKRKLTSAIAFFIMPVILIGTIVATSFAAGGLSAQDRRYDINEDGALNIDDITFLLNFLSNYMPSQATEYTKPTFVVGSALAKAGQSSVGIPITIEKNPGISSIGLQISYPEGLTLTGVLFNATAFPGSCETSPTLTSPATLLWVNFNTEIAEDAIFATLVFDVSPDALGRYEISVTYDEDDVYDYNEENVYFDTVDGVITVAP